MPINSRSGDSTAPDDVEVHEDRQSVAMLRGAPVEVNTHRVTQFICALVAITLAVLSVTLFLSGVHRNSDVVNLQKHGVLVSVTITTCIGELGGSGSNLADYRCEGTFVLHGHRFHDTIPGHAFRATGSTNFFVTSSNSPGVLATPLAVKNENTTSSVFILPSALLIVLVAFVVLVARVRLRQSVVR